MPISDSNPYEQNDGVHNYRNTLIFWAIQFSHIGTGPFKFGNKIFLGFRSFLGRGLKDLELFGLLFL